MYEVIFLDSVHGKTREQFDNFNDAFDFWQAYADTETCIAGELRDDEAGEVIWSFGEI